MKLVAVSRILNEADIVEAFVRHTAAFVDHHVLLDNGSSDGTLAILGALRAEGLGLEVYGNSTAAFAESDQNNFLFQHAARERGADWVVPLDADEFVDFGGQSGRLAECLGQTAFDSVKVRVREFVATSEDDPDELLVPARIRHARAPADNLKVIVRARLANERADLRPGGHGVDSGGVEVPWELLEDVTYAHYSVRSPMQWITKFVMGWSKVLAAGPTAVAAGHSVHYRDPFNWLKTQPAAMLRSPDFLNFQAPGPDLTADPIIYLGGPLQHTHVVDHDMRAVRALMEHLDTLSRSHGALTEALRQRS